MQIIKKPHVTLLLIVSVLFCHQALAQTRYIKDEIFVPMRSGPSSQHRILHKGIRSNTAVETIDGESEEGWVQVRLSSGLEGWIPEQYLLKNPTATIRLAEAQAQLKTLRTQHTATSKELAELKLAYKGSQKTLTNTEAEKQKASIELKKILSISSGAIELDQKYQALLEDHEMLQIANDTINAENMNLKSDRKFSEMFYGAILVLIGMFMAVILPRLKLKKRHSEWSN